MCAKSINLLVSAIITIVFFFNDFNKESIASPEWLFGQEWIYPSLTICTSFHVFWGCVATLEKQKLGARPVPFYGTGHQ